MNPLSDLRKPFTTVPSARHLADKLSVASIVMQRLITPGRLGLTRLSTLANGNRRSISTTSGWSSTGHEH